MTIQEVMEREMMQTETQTQREIVRELKLIKNQKCVDADVPANKSDPYGNFTYTFDYKLSKLAEMLDSLLTLEQKNHRTAKAVVGIISEMNKMQGHYAPEKHLNLNYEIEAQQNFRIQELIQKYQKDY